jgi:ATP-binding cassette, subfamily D (ALD), peroxisomal long-chain fatty acid import protein
MSAASSKQQIARLAAAYARHRPFVQRGLTAAFIFYVLSTTYNGLFSQAGSSSPSNKGKGKSRAKPEGQGTNGKKPPRVAVSRAGMTYLPASQQYLHLQVDVVFYQRLSGILRIVIPSIRSKEAMLLFMHSSLLIFRTVISLYVAALDGK